MSAMIARTYSVPVLADAAGVLVADQLVNRRGMPTMRQAATAYGTSLAYDLFIQDLMRRFLPASPIGMAGDVVMKAAAFTLAEVVVGKVTGDPQALSMKNFLVNGAGLVGSSFAQPMIGGAKPVPGVSSIAKQAAANPMQTI